MIGFTDEHDTVHLAIEEYTEVKTGLIDTGNIIADPVNLRA